MKRTIRARRLSGKTEYKPRLEMLKSEKPRLVVRKTNRYVIAQIVESEIAQDKTIVAVTSKDLLQHGWPEDKAGSLKSLPACYLSGFLVGTAAKSKMKNHSLILDLGLHRNIQKSRIYAVLKGAIDAGLKIPHSPEALPTIEHIMSNKSLAPLIEKIKSKIK